MEKMLELLLSVERSVAVLSGYVRGVLFREPSEPAIIVNEKEVLLSENIPLFVARDTEKSDISVSFDFSKKELTKMKKEFVKHYTEKGLVLNVRAKGNVYEIRYRRDGLSLSASSKVLSEAKRKMRDLLLSAYNAAPSAVKQNRKTAVEYFNWYIDDVKRPTVCERYIRNLKSYVSNHLAPVFKTRYLSEIAFSELQCIINRLVNEGKNRTAKGLRTLMIEVYRSAVYDGEVKANHAERIKPILYEEVHGIALTLAQEKEVRERIVTSSSVHKNDFLILLYTGMRPHELKSARYDGDFIVVKCAKKRKGVIMFRKIPLSPVFKRYVDLNADIGKVETRQLEKSLKVIFDGDISLYDFRHTFITRAQECGVPPEVVQAWVGHSSKTLLGRTYTHYSDEFMLEIAEKLNY